MRKNTFEITLRSGATVRFRAKSCQLAPGQMKWTSYEGQTDQRLERLDLDEVVAMVRLR